MSRLTGRRESGGHWAAASALSVGVHAVALAWLTGLVPDLSAPPPPPARQTVITLAPALEVPDPEAGDAAAGAGADATAEPAAPPPDTLSPEAATETAATPAAERLGAAERDTALAAAPAPVLAPAAPSAALALASDPAPDPANVPRATVAPVETLGAAAVATLAPAPPAAAARAVPAAPSVASVASPTAAATAARADPGAALAPAGAEVAVLSDALPPAAPPPPPPRAAPSGPPPDPALVALVERIRARLDDACLIALPQAQPGPLPPLVTTLTDRDATGAAFARAVLSDPDLPVDHRDLLVDSRQCPAVTFLRAAPRYPAFALSLSLARSQVPSGEVLSGRIDGTAGAYTSLLLVDDNGVVQDLRRFLRFSGGRAEFAIPMTRDGPPRETQALLVALATPARPEAVTRLAGRLAAEVFPALAAQVGPRARLAVQPVDVR